MSGKEETVLISLQILSLSLSFFEFGVEFGVRPSHVTASGHSVTFPP